MFGILSRRSFQLATRPYTVFFIDKMQEKMDQGWIYIGHCNIDCQKWSKAAPLEGIAANQKSKDELKCELHILAKWQLTAFMHDTRNNSSTKATSKIFIENSMLWFWGLQTSGRRYRGCWSSFLRERCIRVNTTCETPRGKYCDSVGQMRLWDKSCTWCVMEGNKPNIVCPTYCSILPQK